MSNIENMAKLIKKAKEDPNFFHALIWDTENALGSVDFLTRAEKARIMKIEPEELVVGLATGNIGGGLSNVEDCGSSCGVSCGVSCGISCGVSCATSCAVSEAIVNPEANISTPTRDELKRNITNEINSNRFSRFTR